MFRTTIYAALIGLLGTPLTAGAEVTISKDIRDEISEVLSEPAEVYELDYKANEKVFDRIDDFFDDYVDFKKSEVREEDGGERVSYRYEVTENKPVKPSKVDTDGAQPGKPFNIFYIIELQKRSFVKELNVPAKHALPDDDAAELAGNFIDDRNFCKTTDNDKLGAPNVIDRVKYRKEDDQSDLEKFTLYQRVEFARELFGLAVANSRIIVDIHPATKEIISFKNIGWTPVKEKDGEKEPYKKLDDILNEIESAYRHADAEYEVTEVEPAYYQDDEKVFPIIVVYADRTAGDGSDDVPVERVLMISLADGYAVDEPYGDLVHPTAGP